MIYEVADDGIVSADVPDLPMILVLARNHDEARRDVVRGSRLYRKEMDRMGKQMPKSMTYCETLSV